MVRFGPSRRHGWTRHVQVGMKTAHESPWGVLRQFRILRFFRFVVIFGGPFVAIIADRVPSRARHPHLEVFADLRSPHESSGARLGTDFRSCS